MFSQGSPSVFKPYEPIMAMNFKLSSTGMWKTWESGTFISNLAPPRLNGKVERSHGTDDREFYQLLTYADDVDLNEKLTEWENYYNFNRPPGEFSGKTPCEALSAWLKNSNNSSAEV